MLRRRINEALFITCLGAVSLAALSIKTMNPNPEHDRGCVPIQEGVCAYECRTSKP